MFLDFVLSVIIAQTVFRLLFLPGVPLFLQCRILLVPWPERSIPRLLLSRLLNSVVPLKRFIRRFFMPAIE